MKSALFALSFVVLPVSTGCVSTCPSVPKDERLTFLSVKPEESGYEILAGDTIQVEVWQNAQLTRAVTVRPDGKITLPLVNDVQAAGMTVVSLQSALTDKLKLYLKDPVVSITVNQFTSKQIYMQGQVRTPAAFTFRGDMYLLQAIALSGGVTPFSEGCAVIVRKKGDRFLRYDVQLEPLLSGESLAENIQLQPNDVISVQ